MDESGRRQRVLDGFWAYSSGQSALGREFARRMRMHTTDSAAIVEIVRGEQIGQPVTPARLAERIGLTSGATSILLNRLEEAGHVTRVRGHADRRRVTLHVTAAVRSSAEEFFAPLRARFDDLAGRYSAEQLDVVEEFVGALCETIEDYVRANDA